MPALSVVPDFSEVASVAVVPKEQKEMLSITKNGEQTVVKINPSSLSLIQTCARKSYYKLERNMRAKVEGAALTAGKAIHKGLEIFYTLGCKDRTMPVRFKENAALQAYGQLPADVIESHYFYKAIAEMLKVAEPLKALPESDKRSPANLTWLLTRYFETYLTDPYISHVDAEGKPLVERRFEFVIYEDPTLKIIVFGTIDIILKNEATGVLLPTDHKTFSQPGNDFLNRIKPNHQYTAYLLGARNVLGIETDEFMVNGFHIIAKPKTAAAKGAQHCRQITKRNKHDLDVEFPQAIMWAVRSYLFWRDSKAWPLGSVDSCAMWGACEFLDVCSAPMNLRENILESKYDIPEVFDGKSH